MSSFFSFWSGVFIIIIAHSLITSGNSHHTDYQDKICKLSFQLGKICVLNQDYVLHASAFKNKFKKLFFP